MSKTYQPGQARVGDHTPQSHPHEFSTADLTAEIQHLMKLNRLYGTHPKRVAAYFKLAKIRATRPDWNPK
jgi:hypothetical protein